MGSTNILALIWAHHTTPSPCYRCRTRWVERKRGEKVCVAGAGEEGRKDEKRKRVIRFFLNLYYLF